MIEEKYLDFEENPALQKELSVDIRVQGMGGVGKTTLAMDLCSDREIKSHCGFHLFKPFLTAEKHFVLRFLSRYSLENPIRFLCGMIL